MRRLHSAFTLVESVVVLAILSITIALFYSLFVVNWIALERQISLVDLEAQADMILERMSAEAQPAASFTVAGDGKAITLTLLDATNIVYTLANGGTLTRSDSVGNMLLAQNVDYAASSFTNQGNYFEANLTFNADVMGNNVVLNVATQVIPRNQP